MPTRPLTIREYRLPVVREVAVPRPVRREPPGSARPEQRRLVAASLLRCPLERG